MYIPLFLKILGEVAISSIFMPGIMVSVHNIGTFVIVKSFIEGTPLPPYREDNVSDVKRVSVVQELRDVCPLLALLYKELACLLM